jgi:hypothetical protein
MIDPTTEEARRLGRMIWDLFIDVRPITEEVAHILDEETHVPYEVWLTLEADYSRGRSIP